MKIYHILTICTSTAILAFSGCSSRADQMTMIQVKTYISKDTGKREVYVSERNRSGSLDVDTGAFEEIVHFTEGNSGSATSARHEVTYSINKQGTLDDVFIINIKTRADDK